MYEAIIFDWDGTLADTEQAILVSFHGALQKIVNLDVADEFIERRIGVGAALTFKEILDAEGLSYNEDTIKRLVQMKIKITLENTDKVQLFPGAADLLMSLEAKTEMGLASMNNREIIERLTRILKVNTYFDTIVTVDDVTRSKPDPEIFLATAKKLGSKPENCVVLEDSIFGVMAAKAGNMRCIAVTQGAYSSSELAKANPDLIVGSLLEKDTILNFISNQKRTS